MSDKSMYSEEYFVILEANSPEQILSAAELKEKLETVLKTRVAPLPRELKKFESFEDRTQYLLENCCELELSPGNLLQWYAVRLEK